MLVLTRRLNETIVIGGGIRVTVIGVKGDKIRLGVEAPDNVRVDREEIHDRREDLLAPSAPLDCPRSFRPVLHNNRW